MEQVVGAVKPLYNDHLLARTGLNPVQPKSILLFMEQLPNSEQPLNISNFLRVTFVVVVLTVFFLK
jgi:hypothetical protein